MNNLVAGIDLGTTYSEIAAFVKDRVQVLGPATNKMLASCVGFSPTGELLVGDAARHQQLLYPELTVRSIKRKMGSAEAVKLGDKTFTPPEISALILRELVEWARRDLNQNVEKAVITVPAYFSDARRNATRVAGHEVERVLVDVSPFSFGPSYLGERGGFPYPHCYHPIIHRNTPLPVTRTDWYYTSHPYQTAVEVEIFQGEDEDALKNILVGDFRIEGLRAIEELNEVLCRMSLDVDGILHVTAIEKATGKSKHITIARALQAKSPSEIAAARERLEALYSPRAEEAEEPSRQKVRDDSTAEGAEITREEGTGESEGKATGVSSTPAEAEREANDLVERSRQRLDSMHPEDKEEAIELHERIQAAISSKDLEALKKASAALRQLLFFVEGH
jgi:molecular chaperone DnaK (HSP70)